ncbi:YadA-like family protein [Synechococcus sp. CBW1004]|uniref:YadA-like family protein n=1 Tax=Synechococcus sp. CBW1004 TaxID=1353136 RepID=UPI00351AEA1F
MRPGRSGRHAPRPGRLTVSAGFAFRAGDKAVATGCDHRPSRPAAAPAGFGVRVEGGRSSLVGTN